MADPSENALSADIGRCPKCGVIGRNHQPPEPDLDDRVMVVSFECLNCGHEWTERAPEEDA